MTCSGEKCRLHIRLKQGCPYLETNPDVTVYMVNLPRDTGHTATYSESEEMLPL